MKPAFFKAAIAAILGLFVPVIGNADSFGSWGGGSSGGSFGSSGGGYGSFGSGYGSSGGSSGGYSRHGLLGGHTPVRNLLGRIHNRIHSHFHPTAGGSSGGWGSSGGFSGGSSGGSSGYSGFAYGSSGGHSSGGSSGGSNGYSSSYSHPVTYGSPVIYGSANTFSNPSLDSSGAYGSELNYSPTNSSYPSFSAPVPAINNEIPQAIPSGADAVRPTENNSAAGDNKTVIKVRVPAEAKIFVNSKPTTSTGELREFVARNLKYGKTYTFPVKAVLEKDGKTEERHEIVSVRGGDLATLTFDFNRAEDVYTAIEVNLPENAKLVLAGNETNRTGAKRVFSTKELKPGESWSNYRVIAMMERDGETVVQEKSLNVFAGEVYKVNFDFNDSDVRVASK